MMLRLDSWYRISAVGFIAFVVGFNIHHSRDVACRGTHCTKGVKRTYPAVNSVNGVCSGGFESVKALMESLSFQLVSARWELVLKVLLLQWMWYNPSFGGTSASATMLSILERNALFLFGTG